jgi:hypothetical protein
VAIPTLALTNARSRWGSCSGKVIRLNWRLIMAPDAVRRSVVAHEVAHLSISTIRPLPRLPRRIVRRRYRCRQPLAESHGRGLYAILG